jgi:hypothetical protein
MERAGRASILVVCLATSVIAAAPPGPSLLSGPYQVGRLGVLNLTITTAQDVKEVKGVYVSGARCDFKPQDSLLEGTFEGSVLVGKLTTCLEGAGCGTTGVVPFLGVVSDTSITTYVTIPGNCAAPGLEDNPLTITIDYAWLKKTGEEAIKAAKWDVAITHLRRAVQLPAGANDPQMLNLLGVAYNGSKAFADGRQTFEAALELAKKKGAPADVKSQLYFNLACSESALAAGDPERQSQAISYLKQALQLSSSALVREGLATDGDLDPLRGLPEFQKLIGRKRPRGAPGYFE